MYEVTEADRKTLDNLFSYHRPFGDQPQRYESIRAAGRQLAEVVIRCTPKSADQSAALRLIREAVMTANAAIACNEIEPPKILVVEERKLPNLAEALSQVHGEADRGPA